MFNRQHVQVSAMCRHFKTQHSKELLIEFEDTLLLPTIKIYQKLSIMDACIGNNEEWPIATKYYCRSCLLKRFKQPKQQNKILYPITKLLEPEEKEELLAKNILFQELNQTTKIEQYLAYPNFSKKLELKWYSDDDKGICPEKAHKTDASFDLRYSEQSFIVIALHSLIRIDLKIALEISVSTMVQIVSRSNLAKKRINVKGEIIDAKYTENIIVMLQNNSNKPYKIKSHKKIAQAIFLPLIKISQLAPVTT
ncbi:hypothetical protein G9A89_020680 [Geosiphon pyriformis]|nr:hypothetical protein G9A89_020680 [Geosiphon pyriformis]